MESAAAQSVAWEEQKAGERLRKAAAEDGGGAPSVLDDVPVALPALTRAAKLQRRAARVGFDWPEARPVLDKLREELGEIEAEIDGGGPAERLEDEVGDLLFSAANLARHLAVDPETALRRANAKFERRFRAIEAVLAAEGRDPAEVRLDELERLWQAAKSAD
jgi:nucleoside triphosphate diphosphatase